VHLWDPGRLRYPWLDDLPALNRPFLPADFRAACGPVALRQAVFVECGCRTPQRLKEVRWITGLARRERGLSGIVAAVRLEQGERARADLEVLARNPLVKGVRRLLQGEADPGFCLQADFVTGVKGLAEFGFSFDLCIAHSQLPAVTRLVRQCPGVRFVLDHAGKPPIREQRLDPWRQHLRSLAALPNVWCKLSGLVTEADHAQWTVGHLQPYIAHVVECFGFDRVMFGGDWPVSTLATDYPRWVEALCAAVAGATEDQLKKLFHDNAREFYRLP
jgi:L-fuconolactonase